MFMNPVPPPITGQPRSATPFGRALAMPLASAITAIFLAAHPAHALSRAPVVTETIPCPAWPALAQRTRSQACAVHEGPLCVPPELWRRWLESQEPQAWCGEIRVQQKASVPLENEPPEGLFSKPHRKLPQLSFKAMDLPRALPAAEHRAVSAEIGGLIPALERARERISEFLKERDTWGVFRSVLLGETAPDRPTGLIRLLGFVHLLSASGIHLYAISTLWSLFFSLFFEWLEVPVELALPITRLAVFLGWALAWAFAGGRPGMLRPWLVVAIRALAQRLGFQWRAWIPLLFALMIDVGWGLARDEPLLSSSRIFYALSVGGGLMLLETRNAGAISAGSWILAGLWEALRGGPVALATPLLSLVTIPVFCGLVYPALLSLGGLYWLFEKDPGPVFLSVVSRALELADGLLGLLIRLAIESPQLWLVRPPWIWLGAAISTGLLAGTARTLPPRKRFGCGLALLLALLAGRGAWPGPPAPLPCAFRDTNCAAQVEQLDVGQGDSALIETPDPARYGLIDAGSEKALGDAGWVTLLAERGINRLGWVALTHLDEDHSGGVKRLAALLPIGCVVTAQAELESERGRRYATQLRLSGLRVEPWTSACVPFPYYPPPYRPPVAGGANAANNQNMGAVLVPLSPDGAYLSAGDADQGEEKPIGRWARAWLANHETGPVPAQRLLKISHHGSATSSDETFLEAFHPTQAWISVGLGNRYGHPAGEVLSRLARLKIEVFRTDRDGSLLTHGGLTRRPP